MKESDIMKSIQVAVSGSGARLFRNQVGQYQLKDGRYIRSGLCVGSSDLIGWTPVVITKEMVGITMAVFTALEVKTENGRSTEEQTAFIETVKNSGGIANIVRSEVEALVTLKCQK